MTPFRRLARTVRIVALLVFTAFACHFFPVESVDAQTQPSLSIDVKISKDNSSPSTTIATGSFSTTSPKELLLAFVASDSSSSSSATVTGITGAGLTWQLVRRTNTQRGTAEIWRAFALTQLSNANVTATLSQSVDSSMTVVSFTGADTSGINGSGAIGATGSGNALHGAPTASLVTTRNGSWVFGVGNDWDNAISRTLGANQTLVHQDLAPVNDTYWVQSQTNTTAQTGTTVTINDSAPATDRFNLSLVEVLQAVDSPPAGPLSIDTQVSSDKSTATTTNTTPAFSTTAANELLLAFVSSDNVSSPNTTVTGITGGGLTWQLVKRTNIQLGTAEIWRAFATTSLSNATVTATLSQSVASSVTVLSFKGVDTSGTNGSGAIGATGTGNALHGAPTASLTTTRGNSWIFGVGNDWDNATSRTTGSNQSLIHQYLATINDTYWVQALNAPTPVGGTNVVLNDSAPTNDRYNLSAVEVLPATNNSPLQISASLSPAPNATGWNKTNVTVSFTCTGGVAPVICPGAQTVSTQGANQTVIGTARDASGATTTASVGLNIDLTTPTVSAMASPAPNQNGWNATPVTVTFICSDSLSGIATCPSPQLIGMQAANQLVTGTATDNAGNSTSASVTLNIGITPPGITATRTPAPNVGGWNNSTVLVNFTCTPGVAPVANCPQTQTVTTQGAGQTITGTVTDLAGNSSSTSVSVSLDTSPPLLNVTSNADGDLVQTSNLVLEGTASDTLSGLSSVTCDGQPASLTGIAFSCSLSLSLGTNSVSVRATDTAGNTAIRNLTLHSVNPVHVQITSPQSLTLFSTNPVTVTGTVDQPQAVVSVNGVNANVSSGSFTATGVVLREAKNLLTATATTAEGAAGSATVTVYLDTSPPTVHIESPKDGATVTTAQINVSGNVNDLVTGTVNAAQVGVTVNSVQAQIANRSFAANGVLLVPGSNLITAIATDHAGNISRHQITVTLQPAAGQQHLVMVSGDNQTSAVSTLLPQPLVVQALDGFDRPMAGRNVTFTVSKSDGTLISGANQGRQLILQTDSNGQALVQFRLGSRNGAAANQVSVTAEGFVGETVFAASSTVGTAVQIHTVSGETQTGAIGHDLAEPFVAIVFDAQGNPVANAPVTFEVKLGDGNIEGQASVVKNTDGDGKAFVVLTLAPQPGINNNVVVASLPGMSASGAIFAASGVTLGSASQTAVSGVVIDNADQPIPNARASIQGTNLSTLSNADGQFTISGAPVGDIVLFVDGSTSTRPESFPTLSFQMVDLPGVNNTLGHPIFLPPIDTDNSKVVGGDDEVQLTMKGVPGVVYTVAPHSVTFPDGSKVGRLTLSQVHADKVPMIPPNGTAPRLVGTLQPAGVAFNPPVKMQLPNTDGLAPGQVLEVFSFHHDVEQFVTEGTAHVTDDGAYILTDPGFGLTVSGWHGGGGNPQPPTCASGCSDPSPCVTATCVNGTCQKTRNIPADQSCHSLKIKAQILDHDDPDADYKPSDETNIYAGSIDKTSDFLKVKAEVDPNVTVDSYTWTVTGDASGPYSPPSSQEWVLGQIQQPTGKLKLHLAVDFSDGETSEEDKEFEVGVRTDDVAVIGWINPDNVPLSTAAVRSDVVAFYPPQGSSGMSLLQKPLSLGYLGVLSSGIPITPTVYLEAIGVGIGAIVTPGSSVLSQEALFALQTQLERLFGINIYLNATDKMYILNWQFKYAANYCGLNRCPPASFASSQDLGNYTSGSFRDQYKLFNRMQIKYRKDGSNFKGGVPDKILRLGVQIGVTHNPIFDFNTLPGEPGPSDNAYSIRNTQESHHVNEGSPDFLAVLNFNTLGSPLKWNDIGSRIVQGVSLGTGKQVVVQVYPTYNIYTNLTQQDSPIPQAPAPIGNFNTNPYYVSTPTGPAPFLIPQ